jgi:peptide/nickel transport system substrate-binding protein
LRYSFLVFNLNDLTGRGLPEVEARQAWFRARGFRRAVSLAIDRSSIARVVYRGRAAPLATHVSPAGGTWRHPALEPPRRDLEAARRELRQAGFRWRGDGSLVDAGDRPVRFSVLVSASSTTRRRIASLLQQDLAPLGITADVVPFDNASLLQRVVASFDYHAVLLELIPQDAGPMAYVSTLVSGGSSHVWKMGAAAPSEWERELDRLMREQGLSPDPERRRELYHRVQEIVATELPFIPLVSPNVLVGARAGLRGLRPSVIGDHLLWNADELHWERPVH